MRKKEKSSLQHRIIQAESAANHSAEPGKKIYLYLLVLLVFTSLIYRSSIYNNFIVTYDDDYYIINNSYIHDLSSEGIQKIFFTTHSDNYSPVSEFIYALQYKLAGPDPRVFHAISLFFHLLNIILVFLLLFSLTKEFLIPLIATAFFALHPMQSEAILWVAAGSTLYYSFFYLLSVSFYLKYTRQKDKRHLLFLSFLFFVLSLLSKVAAVSLPIVLLAIDFYTNKKISRHNLINKIPFLLLSLILLGLAFMLKKGSGAIGTYLMEDYSILDRIFIFIYSYCFYIFKCLLPFNLAAIHFYPPKDGFFLPLLYYFVPLFFVFIIYRIYKFLKKKEISFILVFASLFYTFCIIPHLQILPVGGMVAERYSYLASIGIFLVFGFFISKYTRKFISQKLNYQMWIVLLPMIIFSLITISRIKVWKNGTSLFNDLVEKYPADHYAWFSLGFAKYTDADYDGALKAYNKSILLNKKFPDSYTNRGNVKLQLQDFEGASADFSSALSINPRFTNALNSRGIAKAQLKDYNSALSDLDLAIKIEPSYPDAYNTRGNVHQQMKNYVEAIKDFSRAIYFCPSSENAHFNRGNAAQLMKAYPMALKDYENVIKLNPANSQAHLYSGDIYFELKNKKQACNEWRISSSLGNDEAENFRKTYCQ